MREFPKPTTVVPPPAAHAKYGVLVPAFHRPLRIATVALVLAGAGLAAVTAGLAFARLGPGQGIAFLGVALGGVGLAIAVLRGVRWVLAIVAVGLGGQLAAVIGTAWELNGGVASGKARTLRQLGLSPTVGVLLNLVYSTVAVLLFCWLAQRWLRVRRNLRDGEAAAR
jgi:hypothetical protein